MCGITGFVDFGKNTTLTALENASSQLAHRGPDGNGDFYTANKRYNIGLSSRRLAIIDTSKNGDQPMVSHCKNYVLIFNGTIYNYKELRKKLTVLNYNFNSNSDTEVLLACYITWGKEILNLINGIFAFCIYDKIREKVIIARDNIGVKPLFYSYNNDLLSFASEISALKSYNIDCTIDQQSLAFFLKNGYFPKHSSIYRNIKKVKPSEVLELDLSSQELTKNKFWEIPEQSNHLKNTSEDDIFKKNHALLKQSILSRTVADAKFGVLLSGGIDSATTAAIVQKNNINPIETFTIGFENENIDESANARKIAEYLKTNHNEYILTKEEALEIIKNIGKIYDEPMGDSGAIALYVAVKFASNKVKVLLSSEGGDELFAGYPSYIFAKKWFPIFKLLPKTKLLNFIHPKIFSLSSSKSILEFYNNVNAYFTNEEIYKLIKSPISIPPEKSNKGDDLHKLLSFDINNYLPEDLLMKADRTCMHWGVENRDAMLDKELVSYTSQIPENVKLKHNLKKYILKEIAYQYIPEPLLNQPKKGFSVPIQDWLETDLRDFVLAELKDSSIYDLVNKEQVNYILNMFLKKKRGYYRKVWILLALKLWANEHLSVN